MSSDFDFDSLVIHDNVELPKREIIGRPRGSQYKFEKMRAGQAFFLPLTGEDGATRKDREGNVYELNAAEDLLRKQRQKQSYFSQLGKNLGISIGTRTYDDGGEFNAAYKGQSGIGVWHQGVRNAKDDAEGYEGDDE